MKECYAHAQYGNCEDKACAYQHGPLPLADFERLPYVIERQADGMGGDTELAHVIQADTGRDVRVFSLPFVEPPVPVTGAWLTEYADLLERVADKLVQDVRGYRRVDYCVELGGAPRCIRVTWSGRKREPRK